MALPSCRRVTPSRVATPRGGLPGLLQIIRGIASFGGLRGRPAFRRPRPTGGDQRQYLGDQAAGLRHDLLVAAGGWAQDEFGDPGIDVIGDAGDDCLAVADREVIPGLAAGALLVGLEQRDERWVVGRAEAERDPGAVMVVV